MNAPQRPKRLSDAERFDWLRLYRSDNVGPRSFMALMARYGDARSVLDALPELAARVGVGRAYRIADATAIEAELAQAKRLGVVFVARGEADYPPLLARIASAPPIIGVVGRLEALQQPMVAIVGSRNASAAGLAFTERLARGLGEAGYVVVSGLARGIDHRAHLASLPTGTVGVLAGGHARPYPTEAVPLIERVVEHGATLSEMPVDWEPRAADFPRRNRIVSGLAYGVVVVEAARGSGSLITARLAAEQNREVFAVPGSPLDPRAEGALDLLRSGANLCARVEDVVDVLEPLRGTLGPLAAEESGADWVLEGSDLSAEEESSVDGGEAHAALLALLGPSPVPIDDVVRSAGLPASTVRGLLLDLQIAGKIDFDLGDRVALRS